MEIRTKPGTVVELDNATFGSVVKYKERYFILGNNHNRDDSTLIDVQSGLVVHLPWSTEVEQITTAVLHI